MVKFVKVISSGAGTLTALGDDGETYVLNGTAGWRANNPGNLRPGSLTNGLGAIGVMDTGSNGKFLVFPDRQTGEQARSTLLFDTPTYANKTLLKAIEKYAPTGDNNDPAAYANRLATAAGVDVNTKVSDLTPAQRRAITAAQPNVENNTPGTIKAASGSVRPEVAQQFSAAPLPPRGLPLDAARNMVVGVQSNILDNANSGSRNPGAMANTSTLGWNDGQHVVDGETIRGTLKPADYAQARLTAGNVGGVGSVADTNLSAETSPALARAFARLGAAVSSGAGAGNAIVPAVAPTPMPGRPPDVVKASAPAPLTKEQVHARLMAQQSPDPNQNTGPTVMSGVIGGMVTNAVKSAIPGVQAGISNAAGTVENNIKSGAANLGNQLGGLGSSVTNALGSLGNFLQAPKPQAVSTKPTAAQLRAINAVPAPSAMTPTPAPLRPSGGIAALGANVGAGVGASLKATPQKSVSAVPTMTLAQYNQRQQAMTQQIATAARAVAAPPVVHSNALQAPAPVDIHAVLMAQQSPDQRGLAASQASGQVDQFGMVTGSREKGQWH